MHKTLIAILLSLAVSGCSCLDGAKAPATDDKGKGQGQAPVAQAPGTAGEDAATPTEAELRVVRVEGALREQGLAPTGNETLPTRLGNLEACRPTERRRYNLEGELVYVIVGTYPTDEAADGCITAYETFVGAMWDRFRGDFYRQDRFVIELNPTMDTDVKERVSTAVREALR